MGLRSRPRPTGANQVTATASILRRTPYDNDLTMQRPPVLFTRSYVLGRTLHSCYGRPLWLKWYGCVCETDGSASGRPARGRARWTTEQR